jgi:DNA-directed RNA polymerase subunit M/transcription elongation factor TFIIS
VSKTEHSRPKMHDSAAPPSRNVSEECPSCKTECDTPSLLTSMTRYYVCGRCAARWQIARNWQAFEEGAPIA